MQKGMPIQELYAEVVRQSERKFDVVGNTTMFRMRSLGGYEPHIDLGDNGEFPLTPYTHGQVAQHLHIPKPYYNRMMAEQPELFDQSVNTWLRAAPPAQRRLVRTLDGRARAFLSDGYLDLDNIDLMRWMFNEGGLNELGHTDLEVVSTALTPSNMYIKFQLPSMFAEVGIGDVVTMGFLFKNSEIGRGLIAGLPFITRKKCNNGLCIDKFGIGRHHIGRRIEENEGGDDDIRPYYSDEARQADQRAFFLKVRDVTRSMLNGDIFAKLVLDLKEAAGVKLERPLASIDVVAQKVSMTKDEQELVTKHMIEGGDASLWGLVNAITRASTDLADYDRASEFEALGGKIITLSKAEYREVVMGEVSKKRSAEIEAERALTVLAA